MSKLISRTYWKDALNKPDWYVLIAEDFKRLELLAKQEKDPEIQKGIKQEAYALVENAIQENQLPLADTGEDFDKDRKPIDTAVLHHTKNQPNMTLERLNAIQILRIYGMYFANPTKPEELHLKGQPIWSGHFYKEKQVFWGYHWLVRENGNTVRILDDSYVGWHAGNWDINTRSVGICIDDDLSDKEPKQVVIESIARLIRTNYPELNASNVVGHCDVINTTECPGRLFHGGWQQKLLDKIA